VSESTGLAESSGMQHEDIEQSAWITPPPGDKILDDGEAASAADRSVCERRRHAQRRRRAAMPGVTLTACEPIRAACTVWDRQATCEPWCTQ